jgi:hypothetical protein
MAGAAYAPLAARARARRLRALPFRAFSRPMEAHPPIWRTRLAAMLAGWMAVAVGLALGWWRLAEIAPLPALAALGVAVFIVAPVGLLIWGFVIMLREPMTGWIAPTALLAFAGAFVPLAQPLSDAGAQLNFEDHRPVYDAIVADVLLKRLTGPVSADGVITGERDGVRYAFRPARPGQVRFKWLDAGAFEAGVRYDRARCKPSPAVRCVLQGEPLDGNYSRYWITF